MYLLIYCRGKTSHLFKKGGLSCFSLQQKPLSFSTWFAATLSQPPTLRLLITTSSLRASLRHPWGLGACMRLHHRPAATAFLRYPQPPLKTATAASWVCTASSLRSPSPTSGCHCCVPEVSTASYLRLPVGTVASLMLPPPLYWSYHHHLPQITTSAYLRSQLPI